MSQKTPEEIEFEEKKWSELLKEVPHVEPTPESWPKGIRGLGFFEISNFGIDKNQKIYWNGKAIVTETRLVLSFGQKVLAFFAILATLASIADGLIGTQNWACSMKYWNYCPPVASQIK